MVKFKPSDLSPAQRQAIKDAIKHRRWATTADCGFGKTIVGFTGALVLKKKHPKLMTLIVSNPKGVNGAWAKQYKEWSHTKDMKVVVLNGTPKQRVRKLDREADVHVVSYNSLEWLTAQEHPKYHLVIADEVSCIKGASSKWRDSLLKLSRHAPFRWGLSATPKTSQEDDYWGICRWLDDGKALAPDLESFRAMYMVSYTIPKSRAVVWKVRGGAEEEIQRKVAHLFFGYALSERATIPIHVEEVKARFTGASYIKYLALEKEQTLGALQVGADVEPLGAAQLSAKLNQLASGFIYVDEQLRIPAHELGNYAPAQLKKMMAEKKKVAIDIFDDRIRLLKALIKRIYKEHGKQNIAICYTFKHELELLKQALPEGIDDKANNMEEKWNKGRVPFIFLQYTRSAMSLNLQEGGYIAIAFSPTFRWADDYQIIRRFARQGQKAEKVYWYKMYVRGTIDEMKGTRLEEKFKGHKRFEKMIRRKHNV